jgi:Type IV secretion-system coupling protein DNA-binding domain
VFDPSPPKNDGLKIERSDTDVRLKTPDGSAYELYHPETWQYVGLNDQTAKDIAGGFPEYWDTADAKKGMANASRNDAQLYRRLNDLQEASLDQLAEAHRADKDNLLRLCNADDITIPKQFTLERRFAEECIRHETEQMKEIARIGFSTPAFSPFSHVYMYYKYIHAHSLHIWQRAAAQLLCALLDDRNVRRHAEFLPSLKASPPPPPVESASKNSTLPEKASVSSSESSEGIAHQRGPSLTKQQSLEMAHCRSSSRAIQWGPLFYDQNAVNHSHFCVAATARGGKTTLLRLLFQSLHSNLTPSPRFVFYDAKAKLLPCIFRPGALKGEQLDDEVAAALHLLSPFDQRGTAWDIAQDAPSRAAAHEIATILFPVGDSAQEGYFSPASRDVAAEVMLALNQQSGTKWTLYDLLSALQLENIESVMSVTRRGQDLFANYFRGSSPAVEDLLRTLRSKTALLLPAAATWRNATRRLSIRDWVKSQTKTIVLLNDERHLKASREINRILLNILSQELLSTKNPPVRTFLYLDEFEHLGRIEMMTSLAHRGADLKINMALAFHDLGTLKSVYGTDTEGILGDAHFQAFLKLRTISTSEWASNQIGACEVKVKQKSTQRGTSRQQSATRDEEYSDAWQSGESESEHYVTRQLVLPDEIRNLPMPYDAKQITGYFLAPRHDPYLGTLPQSTVLRSLSEYVAAERSGQKFYALWPEVNGVSEHCPKPDESFDLPDDSFATLYQLGFRKSGYSPDVNLLSNRPDEAILSAQSDDAERPHNGLLDIDFGFDFGDE